MPSRQPNQIHKAAAQDRLKVRAHHPEQAAELAGKKVLASPTAVLNLVKKRASLNKALKAEMSSVASGNSPPAKASGDRLKVSGSAKARAKPNEGKTALSRKVGNEISSVSRANANSGTNNSRVSGNKTGVTSNSRASETVISNSRVSVNRAVINSGVNVRANGTSSSKANVKVNATSSSKANGMASRAAKLAPRH